jgi:uncharacterized membrane protein
VRPTWRRLLPGVIASAAIALLAVAPDVGPRLVSQAQPVQAAHGRIQEIVPARPDESFRPPFANVQIVEGPDTGKTVQAYLEGPGGSQSIANYQVGDDVLVTTTQDESGQPYIAVSDRWRAPLLGWMAVLFAVAVVLVGGWRGIRALLALGLTIALLLKVLLPLVIAGVSPVPLAVVTATAVTVITIVLTEGWTRASGAAILGTAGALALTGILGAAATALASFTYSTGSDLAFLQTSDGRGLDLRGMLLAAFILGAVGVLDDVTVTQAALVSSLADHGARGRGLIASALDVGRSHIAATVNTLFLAYVGAGLPIIVTILVSNQPSALVFNTEEVATEVIRTIVGSLGILAAVPFTTFVAASLVESGTASRRQPAVLATATALIALALVVTAILPLGQGRTALAPTVLDPSALPGVASGPPVDEPSGGGQSSTEPTPESSDATGEPVVVDLGEPFELDAGGSTVQITVDDLHATTTSSGTRVTARVSYHNDGPNAFVVDPSSWSLLTADGQNVALELTKSGPLEAGDLAPGARRGGGLQAVVSASPETIFLAYTDPNDALVFIVPTGG